MEDSNGGAKGAPRPVGASTAGLFEAPNGSACLYHVEREAKQLGRALSK